MKKLLLLFASSLLLTCAIVSSAEGIEKAVSKVEVSKFIFLKSGELLNPTEVHRSDIGKIIACPYENGGRDRPFTITDETFIGGASSSLVRCWKGNLHVGKGYI